MVRIPLAGRRVGGWVLEVDVDPPAEVDLVPIAKVSGLGPSAETIELCRWAAWRWAGRLSTFLGAASPATMVQGLPMRGGGWSPAQRSTPPELRDAFAQQRTVLRLPPARDVTEVALEAASHGDALVVCPSAAMAAEVGARLRREGVRVASFPRDWAMAASGGCVVVGARAAAFAPMPSPASFVVLDEHDEALQHEASPTWHARDVVLERARRARVPAVMTSPCPSLESVARSPLVAPSRAEERAGWPLVELIDRRDDDNARSGLFSPRLVRALRDDGRVVCVLNRTGRARLLACRTCETLAQCEVCEAAVYQDRDDELTCPRCGATRPVVCANCGGTVLKRLRIGVDRAREELEALLREPVAELTGATRGQGVPEASVIVGTEAALHQVPDARAVAFLDFDHELLARRYRAAEEALALLARAARLVGGRDAGGRVLCQTRVPEHEVLRAAVSSNPQLVMDAERERRARLGFPPATTIALVGGPAAPELVTRLGSPLGIEVRTMGDEWLLVAEDRRTLLDVLAAVERPSGRLRLQIDPMRLS
jgi:primosomal protein N' (replication factor Y)